jgi:hypothetical protein
MKSSHPLTDEQVDRLPLDHGRAALLDGILAAPAERVRPITAGPRRRTAVLVGIAAAASVAAIVGLPAWLGQDDPAAPPSDGESSLPVTSEGPSAPADDRLYPVVRGSLPAGWEYGGVGARPIVSLSYERRVTVEGGPGAMTFLVEIRDAGDYEAITHEETTQGGRRAGTIDVDGRTARVWELVEQPGAGTGGCASGCAHHWTAITPIENGQYVLIGGAGLGPDTLAEAEWRQLVASVGLTDRAGFEAWAPDSILFGDELDAAAADAFARTMLPAGRGPTLRLPVFESRSSVELDAAIAAVCAWVPALESRSIAEAGRARDALEAVPSWPLYRDLPAMAHVLLDDLVDRAIEGGPALRGRCR